MAGVLGDRKLNIEHVSADEVLVNNSGTEAYIKGEVGEKIYNVDGQPHVVIKFSEACLTTLTSMEANFPSSFLAYAEAVGQTSLVSGSSSPGSSGSSGSDSENKATFLCGIPIQAGMEKAVRNLDASSLNRFQLSPGAVIPSAAVIPMRSNLMTYGPYNSPNFFSSKGGCNTEQNTDLAPWIFGGSAAMNTAGNALASSSTAGLNQAENGSITLPGLPALQYLGSIASGPNLTSINVSFGSSGITTNYNFQTFTPKFGDLTKSAVEQMKNVSRNRQKQLQFLRNQAIMSYNINRKLKRLNVKGKAGDGKNVGIADGKTLQRCMMGQMSDWYSQSGGPSQRTVVGIDSLAKSALEVRYGYEEKAFMSLDGLYGPISKSGDGGLPQYATYSRDGSTGTGTTPAPPLNQSKASPVHPQPPLAKQPPGGGSGGDEEITLDQYNLDINQKYYDPLTNKITNGAHHHEGDGAGHAIDIVGRGQNPPEDGMIMNALSQSNDDRYSDDYRFLGLRGPLVLHGWGYDTNGKPIPNAVDNDTEASSGTFKTENIQDKFLKDWLNKPKTWPVAPVDLRFDRDRGMWVSPQPYRIVVAKLKEDLPPHGSAKAQLINKNTDNNKEYGATLYDAEGQEIKADDSTSSEAIINTVDRLGKSYKKNDFVYAYYDTVKSEYLILSSGGGSDIIRFKLVDICDPKTPNYGDDWTEANGYGDKYLDDDSYAVRLNCNKQPIDKNGNVLTDADLQNEEILKQHLIIVKGAIGKWGPSFNKLSGSISIWKERAAEGYASKIVDPDPASSSSSTGGSSNPSISCSYNVPCPLSYPDPETGETTTVDDVYDILYLESYARIIHGCLTQDLYCTEDKANEDYAGDNWKKNHPKGNASISITKFYGNHPNGKEPYYMDSTEPISIRVFDPWYDESASPTSTCYDHEQSPLYDAISGTPVIAIFNETLKKYEIIQIGKKPSSSVIRFKLIDKCSSSPAEPGYSDDPWTKFAGYLDKFPDKHILGVRINCDGQPIDKNNNLIVEADISDPDKEKDIFVNLLDTVGIHGPAFAAYTSFGSWKTQAFTGFAAKIDNTSGSCSMGSPIGQCSTPLSQLDSYDIIFLESYARFVECTLIQDLYPEAGATFPGDSFKSQEPNGNASATIDNIYGNAYNGKQPKFFNVSGNEIPFRVFDPFVDIDKAKNPFAKLKYGDKVLAIFDDTKKKYIIYQGGVDNSAAKIVKFALVDNKDVRDPSVRAVLVDYEGYPIDSNNEKLTNLTFNDNIITVYDPFRIRHDQIPGQPSAFGPALGGKTFQEHIEGIDVDDGQEEDITKIGPFIGFAVIRSDIILDTTTSSPQIQTGGSSYGSQATERYEIIQLENFAEFVVGKIGVTQPENGYYHAARSPEGFANGVAPVTRFPVGDNFNLRVNYPLEQFGGGKYIVGDFIEQQNSFDGLYLNVDGCKFIAVLDNVSSDFGNNKEELVYTIIETEHVATRGSTRLIKQDEGADVLNTGQTNEDPDNIKISSTYHDGFQWSKTESRTHYESISIQNREDWVGKPFLVRGVLIHTILTGLSNGNPIYRVQDGETIGRVFELTATSGKIGCNPTDSERKINTGSIYLGGKQALNLNEPPKFTLGGKKWMTYAGSPMFGMLDEHSVGAQVNGADLYHIIYAREAPSIITGTAVSVFTPIQTSGIKISVTHPSGPGADAEPLTTLLNQIENPMGYGAKDGDYVTIQRVYTGFCSSQGVYKYIVIGTGAPPGTGGGGGS